jgi:hypothetical protein
MSALGKLHSGINDVQRWRPLLIGARMLHCVRRQVRAQSEHCIGISR